jgi:SOS-response transcriptional repressor LexA
MRHPREGGGVTDRTARWQRELAYLAQMAQDDYRPSIREIASAVGAANQTVMSDLAELVRGGLVADCDVPAGRRRRGRRAARAFVITDLGLAQVRGGAPQPQPVAAGPPSDQPTMTGFDVEVDAGGAFTIPPGHLAVRARGDSMIDAGIEPHDVVVLRQSERAENGQIVLAEVDGTADDGALTLKRIYWEDDQVRLQPANASYEPMYRSSDGVRIRGVAVEVIHRRRL